MATVGDIFDEIVNEREYQIRKWGEEADVSLNTPWHWASYIAKYATSWMQGTWSLDEQGVKAFRTAMLKVATLAVGAIQALDKQITENGKPFFQAEDG